MSTGKRNVIITYRSAAAGLAWVAVFAQLAWQITSHNSVSNFFSYFTIQSNLIGIAALTLGATILAGVVKKPKSFEAWRGAATFYLTVTGVVYALLLSNLPDGARNIQPWVDVVLHKALPVVMVFDWLFDRPTVRLSRKVALVWLAYPIAYLAYSLIRGAAVHWYPYPFINPSQGYLKVAATSLIIAIVGFLAALLIAAWPKRAKANV